MPPRLVLLTLVVASWAMVCLARPGLAAPTPSPLADTARRLGTLRTTLERAERAESRAACLEALSEADALLEADAGTLPDHLRKTVDAARSATWPRYMRRLLADARLQTENGEDALRARESASSQEEGAAREHLRQVLERSEFTWTRRAQGLLKRWGQWLKKLFEGWGTTTDRPQRLDWSWLDAAGRVVIGLVVLVLAWLLVLALRSALGVQWRKKAVDEADARPADVRVERLLASTEWLERARVEASRSDYRSAVRCLFMGLLVRLGEIGRVHLATGQTNWEIVRQLQDDADRPELEAATRLYESKWYGMREATPDDLGRLREHFEHLAGPQDGRNPGGTP